MIALGSWPCFTPHPSSRLHVRGLYLILVPPLRAQVELNRVRQKSSPKHSSLFFLQYQQQQTLTSGTDTRSKAIATPECSVVHTLVLHSGRRGPWRCRYRLSDVLRVALPALLCCADVPASKDSIDIPPVSGNNWYKPCLAFGFILQLALRALLVSECFPWDWSISLRLRHCSPIRPDLDQTSRLTRHNGLPRAIEHSPD